MPDGPHPSEKKKPGEKMGALHGTPLLCFSHPWTVWNQPDGTR